MKSVKCYLCKKKVDKEVAKVHIHETEKNKYKRYFHEECFDEYLIHLEEKKKLGELYNFIKYEIFKYDEHQSLSPHLVTRLQGIRSGQFKPRKNSKVFGSNSGYNYETILLTFKVKKVDIINAISNNTKFPTQKNKEDYMIAIILNSINDVYFKQQEMEESNQRVSEIKIDIDNESEFINKTKINNNKVADKLKHLF